MPEWGYAHFHVPLAFRQFTRSFRISVAKPTGISLSKLLARKFMLHDLALERQATWAPFLFLSCIIRRSHGTILRSPLLFHTSCWPHCTTTIRTIGDFTGKTI